MKLFAAETRHPTTFLASPSADPEIAADLRSPLSRSVRNPRLSLSLSLRSTHVRNNDVDDDKTRFIRSRRQLSFRSIIAYTARGLAVRYALARWRCTLLVIALSGLTVARVSAPLTFSALKLGEMTIIRLY